MMDLGTVYITVSDYNALILAKNAAEMHCALLEKKLNKIENLAVTAVRDIKEEMKDYATVSCKDVLNIIND